MSTAGTAAVSTYAGFLAQLNSLTDGIDMVPSSFCEETIYEFSPEAQKPLPALINMDGSRTAVREVIEKSFPIESREGEKALRAKSAEFTARIEYIDNLLDREVQTVFMGLRNRSPETFDSVQAFEDFWRFVDFYSVERTKTRVLTRLDDMAVTAGEYLLTTAGLNEEIDKAAGANAYFISGRLFASHSSGKAQDKAVDAFMKAAEIFAELDRFISAGVARELAAEIKESRGEDASEIRKAAADAWHQSSEWAIDHNSDMPSIELRIFRGLWNAYKAGDTETMISFLETSAERLAEAEKYASAADNYVRILNIELGTDPDAGSEDWGTVAAYMGALLGYAKKAELPEGYLQGLIDLSNDIVDQA
jgi:hypothetical protein